MRTRIDNICLVAFILGLVTIFGGCVFEWVYRQPINTFSGLTAFFSIVFGFILVISAFTAFHLSERKFLELTDRKHNIGIDLFVIAFLVFAVISVYVYSFNPKTMWFAIPLIVDVIIGYFGYQFNEKYYLSEKE